MNKTTFGIATVFVGLALGPDVARASAQCPAGYENIDGHCQGANHPQHHAFTGHLPMKTSCEYGSAHCNVCVDDVGKRFTQIKNGFDTDASLYSFKWKDACAKGSDDSCFTSNTSDHWHFQSLMRFATSANQGSWMVTTRSVENGPGRIGVIEMGTYDGSAYPWRGKGFKTRKNKLVAWQRVGKLKNGFLNHASGAQMVGSTLFTGVECFDNSDCENHKAIVRIVDLSTPSSPEQRAFIALDRGSADAAAARLKDGYLVMTHSDDGGSDNERLYFYRSDALETGWKRIGAWNPAKLKGIDDSFGCEDQSYQNISLVTQCDGKLYMVGLCRESFWGDTDWADLFRIDGFEDGVPKITKVGKKKLGMEHGASFWWGGGVYVDPKHRMSFYATEGTTQGDDYTVFVNEFAGLGN
jgi:hypothetical protein